MARTQVFQDNFKLGERSDYPLDQMPAGSVWTASNVIVDNSIGSGYSTRVRSRGGWTHGSSDITASSSSASYVQALGWWSGLSYPLWIADDEGYVSKCNPSTGALSAQASTSMSAMSQNAVVFSERIVFFQEGKYPFHFSGVGTSGSLSIYGIPAAKVGVAAFGKLFVANSSDKPARIWFNKTPSVSTDHPITLWDTAEPGGLWVDSSHKVTALAAVNNAVLVFSGAHVERLRGTFFNYGDSTVEIKPLFAEGVSNPFAVATGAGFVYFANANSLWRTDGGTVIDFAAELGIRRKLSGLSSVALGLWRDYLFVSTGTGSTSPCYVINLTTGSVVTFTNIGASSFQGSDDVTDELFFNHIAVSPLTYQRAARMSPAFTGSALADADTNSGAVSILTPFRDMGGRGLKRFRDVYLTYENGESATVYPYYLEDASDYAANGTVSFDAASTMTRARTALNKRARGVGLNIIASESVLGRFSLQSIEIEAQAQEQSKLG